MGALFEPSMTVPWIVSSAAIIPPTCEWALASETYVSKCICIVCKQSAIGNFETMPVKTLKSPVIQFCYVCLHRCRQTNFITNQVVIFFLNYEAGLFGFFKN